MSRNHDLSDITRFLEQIKTQTQQAMEEVGEEAVRYAIENGSYQDQTGRLRASNRFRVEGDSLIVENTAPYARDVEAKGYEVVSGAALFAETELRKRAERK